MRHMFRAQPRGGQDQAEMRHLHPIVEDEMVAVFLRTEAASTRFGPAILSLLRRDGQDRRVVDHPDLSDAAEIAYRRRLLGEHRGYGRDADVFTGFPDGVRWYRAVATREELARVRYIDDDYWIELSGGSRRATDAAARIRRGFEAFRVGNGGFWYLADALCAGATFPELILVGTDERAPLVLLEGHSRLTAYCLRPDCTPEELPVLVGYHPEMAK
jgi:hypothetical protein